MPLKTFCFILIFILLDFAGAEISTTFYRNNPQLTGELMGSADVANMAPAWQVNLSLTGSDGNLAPMVAQGRIYYAWNGNAVCRDAFTGNEIWSINNSLIRMNVLNADYKYTPQPQNAAVVSKYVLLPTTDGKIFALDTADGKELWVYESKGFITNPTISHDTVYFTDSTGIVALSPYTGQEIWRKMVVGKLPSKDAGVVVADGHVYYGTIDGYVIKVNMTSHEVVWNKPVWSWGVDSVWNDGYKLWFKTHFNGTFCYSDGYIYATFTAHYYAISTMSGTVRMDAQTGDIVKESSSLTGFTWCGIQIKGNTAILGGAHGKEEGGLSHEALKQKWNWNGKRDNYIYGGITIVGTQAYYGSWGTGPLRGIDVETGNLDQEISSFNRSNRAPSFYFPDNTEDVYAYFADNTGLNAVKGTRSGDVNIKSIRIIEKSDGLFIFPNPVRSNGFINIGFTEPAGT
ncbi:MAG: PQQ-binding-like beta-propeller repeat protein, partial [bacterium]